MIEQLDLFGSTQFPYKITKPIRLIELFAGIGSQAKALENLGANFEHYRICEFDKYAIKSYNAIHGTNFEPSDITKITAKDLGIVDTWKYDYIMCYSFPCQDLSVSGKKQGMDKGSGTRSGLLWEVERLLNECKELPQILIMENVSSVHAIKNLKNFNDWLNFLESKGYSNYYRDLNAKNYGIPQNRERCLMVSILGDYGYKFPSEIELTLKLKDILESNVDKKYYLKKVLRPEKKDKYIQYDNSGKGYNSQAARLYYQDGLAPSLPYCNANGDKSQIILCDKEEIQTNLSCFQTDYIDNCKIRKLTPKECYRLMGFDDEDFEKAAQVNSNAQLYKQAGNSIVVNVLMAIFKQLL